MRKYLIAAIAAALLWGPGGYVSADYIRQLDSEQIRAKSVIVGDDAPSSAPAVGDMQIQGALGVTGTRTLQTTENKQTTLSLTTDSTFLTGTNITYSGGRGSSDLNLAGTWSATAGGYSNLYSLTTASGILNDANGGAIGGKFVTNAAAAQTAAAGIYGLQGIARHSAATGIKAANEAPFVGVEGVVTQGGAGQIGTAIGVSAAYHIPADADAFDGGAVFRGMQITLDNASGNSPSEETGLAIWNMAGTQTNGIKLIKSGSGFTNDIVLQSGDTIINAAAGTTTFSGAVTSSATSTLGWSIRSSTNQACTTTCTSACVMGVDTAASSYLACADATADVCLCAGAS